MSSNDGYENEVALTSQSKAGSARYQVPQRQQPADTTEDLYEDVSMVSTNKPSKQMKDATSRSTLFVYILTRQI